MTLVRWDPFVRDFQSRLSRLLDQPYGPVQASEETALAVWAPAVDIYEQDGQIVVNAELPGIDPKDVSLTVEQNVLTLRGERRSQKDVKDESYHRKESLYGSFSRSFTLPREVDRDKIKATYKDGVLKVVVPQKPEAQPKQITVESAA
jgi:HSP20 family protein